MTLLKLYRIPYFRIVNIVKPFIRNYNDIPFEDIPEVSPAIIKRSLKAHNISFDDGFTCFIITCPSCQKTTKTNLKNVYINKTTGMFMCASCKQTGQWDSLEKRFTTKKKRIKSTDDQQESLINETERLNEFIRNIQDRTDQVKLFDQEKFCDILKKFQLPLISKNSIDNLDIRVDKTEEDLYFPLENINFEIVGYRKYNRLNRTDIIMPNLIYGGLLTGKTTKTKDTAILVPNIEDFLVLLDTKINGNIVCLPNGVNNLSQYVLPTLERYKKLILWFGNDLKSWDSARHFAKKLGEKRCLFVRPSEKSLLPHLIDKTQYKTIINSAQPIWHKSITTFSSLRQDVLLDLQNIDKVQGVKWKRYPQLNKILKGHRRGELTVFTGPTGSGKTTFISDYSLDLATQGVIINLRTKPVINVNTLWGSFEIRNVRLAKTMLQQFAGIPLDENLQFFDNWADKFEQLPIYFMTFHGQQSLKIVMEAVEHATYVHDIAHVIIDNLQFMMGTSDDYKYMDRFWKQDTIITAFRTFATRKNCHVTLVIHPRKERDDEDLTTSSIFGGAKASQEADNVLIIQDKRLTAIGGKKYLQIAKNRYSGDLGIMALDFDKQSLSFAKKKKAAQKETTEKNS